MAKKLKLDRDLLGRLVREAWVRWAQKQKNPKASWLVPWEWLGEPEKEADRQIGESVAHWVLAYMPGETDRASSRLVGLVRDLEVALKEIHSNRLHDDAGLCDCGECSQCIARIALDRIADILPMTKVAAPATQKADGPTGSLEDPCPHPARRGRHEIYLAGKGTLVCRACGRRGPQR
jgi:hypothetical protein